MLLQFSNKLGGALFVPSFTIHSLLTRIISTFNIFDGPIFTGTKNTWKVEKEAVWHG